MATLDSDRTPISRVWERVPNQVRTISPLVPAFILVGTFIFYPIIQALYTSFFEKSLLTPGDAEFVGLQHYQEIFAEPELQQVLIKTFIWVGLGSGISLLIGFLTGYMLYMKVPSRLQNIVGGVVLIPWILPRVVGASLFSFMFSGSRGIINEFLLQLGIIDEYIIMLGSLELSLFPPIVGMIWRLFPLFALLTLLSLQAIDERLYEAARVDGASPWIQFRHITLPQMKYAIAIGLLLLLIYNVRNFAMIWVMTEGGPILSSTTLPIMIYKSAFQNQNLGMASALSTLLFMILAVFAAFYIRIYDRVRDQYG